METIGIINFSGGLTSHAIHPSGISLGGWNFNAATDVIQAVGDLSGDGYTDFIITSEWGIGVFSYDGSNFTQLFGAPIATLFANTIPTVNWLYDASTNRGRDKIIDIQKFTSTSDDIVLIWSSWGMGTLKLNSSRSLIPLTTFANGTLIGGWTLDTLGNVYCGSGKFDTRSGISIVLTNPLSLLNPILGIISLSGSTLVTVFSSRIYDENGLVSFNLTQDDKIRHIADFDGDGFDEILIETYNGIAIVKLIGSNLKLIALHTDSYQNLGIFDGTNTNIFPIADQFSHGDIRSELLCFNPRGLYILRYNSDSKQLEKRIFHDINNSIDGWILSWETTTFLKIGNVGNIGSANFLIRSPWGIGVVSAHTPDFFGHLNLSDINKFNCISAHEYGTHLGSWKLESSDIIVGGCNFLGPLLLKKDFLFLKPYTNSTPTIVNRVFTNWHRNISASIDTTVPNNLLELVNSVIDIGSRGGVVGIAGSGWSFTDCVANSRTQYLIDTSKLNATLGRLIPLIIDNRIVFSDKQLIHVEAGIKLYDLNCRLNSLGLALPTMGGSRGQSLAGAISTGVHGADVSLPPIADAVRAIHLVGTEGQQWWIEPASHPISSKTTIDRAKAQGILDPGIHVVYDDEWFNAVLVSMGCAGVIYSLVIECRPAFRLRSTTTAEDWSFAQTRISALLTTPRRLRPRFLEINVIPSDLHCRVTVRNETLDAVLTIPISRPHCESIAETIGTTVLFIASLGDYIGKKSLELTGLSFIPGLGPWLATKKTVEEIAPLKNLYDRLKNLNLEGITPENLSNSRGIAEVLPDIINLIWHIQGFVPGGRIIVDKLQAKITDEARPVGTKIDSSYKIMTEQPDCPADGSQTHDETQHLVESFEYSVHADKAIDFVNGLIEACRKLREGEEAIVVNFNLRFTGKTRATLGMQQFDDTCHVEIYTIRGLNGNAAFKTRMQEVVRSFHALPHWGQLHEQNEANNFTPISLASWQNVIRLISGSNEMFWSDFARNRRLFS